MCECDDHEAGCPLEMEETVQVECGRARRGGWTLLAELGMRMAFSHSMRTVT